MSNQAKFRVGDQVKVKHLDYSTHVRTPGYVHGRTGVVERYCGRYINPEKRALGGSGKPRVALYRVRFDAAPLFPEHECEADTVDVEIFEHWLEANNND